MTVNTIPMELPDDKIIIYQSELDYLSRCILEYPHIETGGNLFGLWTPFGIPFIQYVVGPGPKAMHNPTHFRQDFRFLDKNADFLVDEHALHHIGSWHSHHSLGLSEPSHGDTESTFSGMRECSLPSFILLIGNYRHGKSTVNAFRYFSNGTMMKLNWVVLNGTSPIREVYDKAHPEYVYSPSGTANMAPLEREELIEDSRQTETPQFKEEYWLSVKENRKEFAAMVKKLKDKYGDVGIFQLDNSTVELRITNPAGNFNILMDASFPKEPPKLQKAGQMIENTTNAPLWNIEGSTISEVFMNYINTIEL